MSRRQRLVRSPGIRVEVETARGLARRHVQVVDVEEAHVPVPDVDLVALRDLHVEDLPGEPVQAVEDLRQREVLLQDLVVVAGVNWRILVTQRNFDVFVI